MAARDLHVASVKYALQCVTKTNVFSKLSLLRVHYNLLMGLAASAQNSEHVSVIQAEI